MRRLFLVALVNLDTLPLRGNVPRILDRALY